MLDNMLDKYKEKFGESFPLFVYRNRTEAEILHTIQECLNTGEPVKLSSSKNVSY